MIDVQIDISELERTMHRLGASEKEVGRALASTMAKMSRWLRVRAQRGLAQKLNVPGKALSNRLRASVSGRQQDARGRVWIGLNPLSLIHLKPRQSKKGVRARGELYEGAFMATGKGGQQVFRRRGKERLPLDKVTRDIEQEARPYIEDELLDAQFHAQFYKVFEENLRWHQHR